MIAEIRTNWRTTGGAPCLLPAGLGALRSFQPWVLALEEGQNETSHSELLGRALPLDLGRDPGSGSKVAV